MTNTLDEDTSIHWHGLLVPFQMDGVPGISFPGIRPRETFVYEFTWPSPALDGALGACHMAEIGFVFGNLAHPLAGPDAPQELSDRVREAWSSFARTGRPTAARPPGGGLPRLQLHNDGGATGSLLGAQSDLAASRTSSA